MLTETKSNAVFLHHTIFLSLSIFIIWSHTSLFLLVWKWNQTRMPVFIRSLPPPVTSTKKGSFSKHPFYFLSRNPYRRSIQEFIILHQEFKHDGVRMIGCVHMESMVWNQILWWRKSQGKNTRCFDFYSLPEEHWEDTGDQYLLMP